MRENVSRRRALAALGLTGSTLLAGCNALGSTADESDDDEDEDEPDAEDADTTADTETEAGAADDSESFLDTEANPPLEPPYTFGLSPTEPQNYMLTQYAPVREYLTANLAETELSYAASDQAILTGLRSGDMAFAETRLFTAGFAIKDDAAEVALQRRAYGNWAYTSVVVTREDSDIQSLEELDGAELAFADPTSASGSLFPLWMLDQAGLSVGDAPGSDAGADFEGVWAGHAQAYKSLVDGQVDAACVGKFITQDGDRYIDGIEPIADYREDYNSNGIPRAPMLTSAALPERTKEAFVDAMHDAPERVYHGEDGEPNTDDDVWFTNVRPADAATYDPVLQVIDDLELTLDGLEQ